jgi:alcohol dehydrogenase (cytochrome c)
VPSGEDDVFAVDASSGKILWEHKANLDQKISVVCCGWLSRGVALGEGNVDIGQLDCKPRRARPEDGQGRLEDARDAVAARVLDHERPLYYDGL